MTNLTRSQFQAHPFHLVSPSPWPLNTSLCLLATTFSAVLSFHGFIRGIDLLIVALICVVYSMSLWFRDVISEGIPKSLLSKYTVNKIKSISLKKYHTSDRNQLGYYIAGLLEGDGHISLPFLGKTILNRILNPRIVFTGHIKDIELYKNIQSQLNDIGRIQIVGNIVRYIIGDREGIIFLINLVNNKFRTPKIYSLNKLIEFMNQKYQLNLSLSKLDESDLLTNSWFTGFTEADGHFGVVIRYSKPKSETRKRSISNSINLKFVLAQRSVDKISSLSLLPIMQKIAATFSCNLHEYKTKKNGQYLCINISAFNKLDLIVNYFKNHSLLGIKNENFKDWLKVYSMICSKEHLTKLGFEKIILIQSNMNSKRQSSTTLNSSVLIYLLFIFISF
jgi:hypothetical protein